MSVTNIDDAKKKRDEEAKERVLNNPLRKKTILDDDKKYSDVNLLDYIDDNHILKKLALSIENAKFIAYPASTAFLVLASVFSGFAGRAFKVARYDGDNVGIPIGLYAVCEQPSGSGKDFPIDLITGCFNGAHRDFEKAIKKQLSEILDKKEQYLEACHGEIPKKDTEYKFICKAEKEIKALLESSENYSLDLSDTTAEGLEVSIIDSGGHFTLASSEQELFDVMLCGLYSNGASNKGLILKSFDGGSVKVKRAGRKTFKGIGAGSFTMFAQSGSLKKLYSSSGQTGLAERFLKLVEPNRGGKRDFVNGKNFNFHLVDELKDIIEPIISAIINVDNITSPKSFYDLSMLRLSDASLVKLNYFRNEMEKTVDVGGVYHDSKADMLGTLTKCDIQVFKLASVLHLSDGGYFFPVIPDKHVDSCINIVRAILMSYHGLMENQSIIGDKAAYEKVIEYLSCQSKARTKIEISQNLKGRKPFTMDNSYKYIGVIVDQMIMHDILKIEIDQSLIERIVVC